MAIAVERREQTQSIRLSGCVDISAAAGLKRVLTEALEAQLVLRMDVSALESVDVTVIQLLWAAKSEAMMAGREFCIDGPWNPEIESRLHQAGISPSRIFATPQQETGRTIGLEL